MSSPAPQFEDRRWLPARIGERGIGNRAGGVLYREGIAKISSFARSCDDDGIPLVWLQDISGFDIGGIDVLAVVKSSS